MKFEIMEKSIFKKPEEMVIGKSYLIQTGEEYVQGVYGGRFGGLEGGIIKLYEVRELDINTTDKWKNVGEKRIPLGEEPIISLDYCPVS